MRRVAALSVVLLSLSTLACDRSPRLRGDSLLALHQSTEAMKDSLALSARDAVTLDGAIDVLVGDATRDLLAQAETGEASPQERASAEAEALAPVDGLSLVEVISAAAERTDRELAGLLAELDERETMAVEDGERLGRVQVVRALYGMSPGSRRSWVDLTVHNGTDHALYELVLDCRLVERDDVVREQGTCRVTFPSGLAPAASAVAHSYVDWDSEPRSSRVVEAWPIRAYGPGRSLLWDVPSELDPREAGELGELRSRVSLVDGQLRQLRSFELPNE